MNTRNILGFLALAFALSPVGRAQLVVDIGGPRNIFVPGKSSGASAPRFVTLDSKAKSLGLDFLTLPRVGYLVFGGKASISAPDGLGELLNSGKTLKLQGDVLVNWTDYNTEHPLWSITGRVSTSEVSYSLQDPTTKQVSSQAFGTGEGALTVAYATSGLEYSLALTMGYKPDNNIASLPPVDLGNGKSARVGPLQRFETYPLQLLVVRRLEVHWKWLEVLPMVPEDSFKFLLPSLYVRLGLRSTGNTAQTYGFNLALMAKTKPSDGGGDVGKPSKTKTTYPYSIFVECTRGYDQTHFTTTGGVSTVFSF